MRSEATDDPFAPSGHRWEHRASGAWRTLATLVGVGRLRRQRLGDRYVVLFNDVPCRWRYKSICPERRHLRLRGVEPAAVVRAALQLLRDSDAVAEASPLGGRSGLA